MKFRNVSRKALLAAALSAVSAISSAGTPPPKPESWIAIGKLPDFSGVWEVVMARGAPAEMPSLTPAYAAKQQAYRAEQDKGGNQDNETANCLPPGMPQIMNQPYPMEFLVTPGKITVVIEAYSQMRRIFTDGRKHPDDPDLTFNGHSIGRWDGSTLVVDSVGFVADTPLGQNGLQHSDKMPITDPLALTKPWTSTKTLVRHRDWDITEYVCEQNNRNSVNEEGKAHINLEK
jgi:hypothetical protein